MYSSLVFNLCTPPGEKQSGEQSCISWAYFQTVVMTNEIARLVIITWNFPYNSKIYSNNCTFFEKVWHEMF